jgi:hypothetical protein
MCIRDRKQSELIGEIPQKRNWFFSYTFDMNLKAIYLLKIIPPPPPKKRRSIWIRVDSLKLIAVFFSTRRRRVTEFVFNYRP